LGEYVVLKHQTPNTPALSPGGRGQPLLGRAPSRGGNSVVVYISCLPDECFRFPLSGFSFHLLVFSFQPLAFSLTLMKQMKITSVALAACVTLLNAGEHRSQDWPQWRGPNRDGKAIGFTAPESWPPQLKQQWKANVGVGDSTPALVGGKLYALGRQDTDEVMTCFDAATGKTNWEPRYPADYVVTAPPARHPGTRSSPVAAGGKVCALGAGV